MIALQGHGIVVERVATTGAEAIEAVRDDAPELALVDVGLPDRSGLVVGKQILEISPDTTVVALTALADHRVAQSALRAGFKGYVTKDTPVSKLVQILRTALDGHVVVPQGLATRVAGNRTMEEEHDALLMGQLTGREREVLSLLVQGMSGPAISTRLHISPNTVRTHVQSILTKLQVHSRLEAASFAVRHRMHASPHSGWESAGA